MITLNVRTNDAGIFCLLFQYLIEHLIEGKQKEEINWPLVHTINNLFLKMEKITDIVDDVLLIELSEKEARTFYFTLTQKKYREALEANPKAMEGSFYGSLLLIREKMIYQLAAKLKAAQLSEDELRLEIAILLYEMGRFTTGQAGKFAGMNRIQFQKELGKRKISVNYDLVVCQA